MSEKLNLPHICLRCEIVTSINEKRARRIFW